MKKKLLVRPVVLLLAFACLYVLAREISIRINNDRPMRVVKDISSRSNSNETKLETDDGQAKTLNLQKVESPKPAPQYRLKTNINYTYQSGWENDTNWSYIYDNAGNNVEIIINEWKDNSWQRQRRLTKQFDSKNQLIETKEYGWQDNSWVLRFKTTNDYDKDGNISITYWYNYSNPGGKVAGTKWVYSYISKGKEDIAIVYTLTDTGFSKIGKNKKYYNELGQEIKTRKMKIINGNLVTIMNEDHYYDNEGNEVRTEFMNWSEDLTIENQSVSNQAYFNKKLINRTADVLFRGELHKSHELFKYNQNGDIEEHLRQSFANGVWVDWIKHVYYYEQKDEL